ncbi:Fc.00g080810.m01.CDS01 [Cosmosporella sp. VM-42]
MDTLTYGSEEPYTPQGFPGKLRRLAWAHSIIGAIIWMLDVAATTIALEALTGEESDGKGNGVKPKVHVSFTPLAGRVQRTEIALSAIGLVWTISVTLSHAFLLASLYCQFTTPNAKAVRRRYLQIYISSNIVFFAAWIILIVYQAQYVPVLGRTQLSACVQHPHAKQCKMINGSWIGGIMYCCLHFMTLVLKLEIFRRLFYPDGLVWPPPPEEVPDVTLTPGPLKHPETDFVRRDSLSEGILGGPSKIE